MEETSLSQSQLGDLDFITYKFENLAWKVKKKRWIFENQVLVYDNL
jgi:hypothetical protein